MENKNVYCLNCGSMLEAKDQFCPQCGQKKNAFKLKIKEIGDQFIVTLFNIDNTFFRTIRLLPTPWILTRNFVAGQRIPYYHPARMFIILLFLLYSLTTLFQKESFDLVLGDDFFYTKHDFELKDSLSYLMTRIPEIKIHENEIYNAVFKDSMIPDDTMIFEPFIVLKDVSNIPLRDVLTRDINDIYATYNITGFWEKIYVEQSVKMYKNNQDFISYFIKNALWSLPFAIMLSSILLYLLYFRIGCYYLEHVMLQFHIHSSIFSFFIIAIILDYFLSVKDSFLAISLGPVVTLILPPLAFYKYYGQNMWKTLIKYFLFILVYAVSVAVGIVLTLIASAVFF